MRARLLTIAGLGLLAGLANATVTFNFDQVYSGDTPGGTSPWATLSISNDGAGQVKFTLSHNAGSTAGQFLTELDLSMTGIPGDFASVTPLDSKISGIDFGDNFTTDAGQQFDYRVSFQTTGSGGGVHRLKPGESVSWDMTGTGLTEDVFNTLSDPHGATSPVFALLHLQGIPGGGSAKLAPVPEPATLSILGIGALGLIRRRRQSK
jgi:hypothetical protein